MPFASPRFMALKPSSRFLSDAGRSGGFLCVSTRGTGKSRALGRLVAFPDFLRGVSQVVIDPLGGTIDNFLDKLTRLPAALQAKLLSRLRYVNMAGQNDRVTPWPIYYRAIPSESLASISQRYVDVIRRADPALANASIMGMPRLARLATAGGMVAAALGLGVTEVDGMLADPTAWIPRFEEVCFKFPECVGAVEDLLAFSRLGRDLATWAEPLRNKLMLFRHDPAIKAMFSATRGEIDWQEVADRRLTVLVDFREVSSTSLMQFSLLWVFITLLDYIRRRTNDKTQRPFAVMLDELSYFVGAGSLNADLLTADFEELINRQMRNKSVWLTVAVQEQNQLPEKLLATLLGMGNALFGSTSDSLAAIRLGKRFLPYDPYRVKQFVPAGRAEVRAVGFTIQEQELLNARPFLTLPRFHFLAAGSVQEGTLPTRLQHLSIEGVDAGEYPQEAPITALRRELTERDGVPIADLLAAIERRNPEKQQQKTSTILNKRNNSPTIIRSGRNLTHYDAPNIPEFDYDDADTSSDAAGTGSTVDPV
jgi:hypothetical protein